MKIKKSGIILMGVMGSLLFGTSVYAESYASVKVDTLNVRQGPKTEAAVTGVYSKDDTVKIINQAIPGWYGIENNNGKIAYVSAEHVNVFKVKAKVNGNGVSSKTYPAPDAKTNRELSNGQDISVYYEVGDWYYTSLGSEASFGFIHKKYVDSEFLYLLPKRNISEVKEIEMKTPQETKATEEKKAPQETKATEEKKAPQTTKADEVVEYAKKFVGNPYRYGGTSLTKGVDCSGFTQQIMKKAGISLQRSSAAQYANNGVKVSTNNLQPGDLLFYGYNGRVSHVGIYIGNKKMVNASNAKTGITISNAFRTSGKPLIGAKRVI